MKRWTLQEVAQAAGADVLSPGAVTGGPTDAAIDSRQATDGVLFIGLPGEHVHGGDFSAQALANGAWGVLTDHAHAEAAISGLEHGNGGGAVLAAADPLVALQRLANAWRRELGRAGAQVIGVTGSTGKTSTKDILLALLSPQRRTVASRANLNTEIGLPLQLLSAPEGTEVLVLEMGMRGPGQITELATIAEPDVGVIVSIGPVHLELLGSLENIAAAKAELIAGLAPGQTAVVPAGEALLAPHLREDVATVTFGPGGEVTMVDQSGDHVTIDHLGTRLSLGVDFSAAHLRRNLLAAVAAAIAVGVTPRGNVNLALSPGRGQRVELAGDVVLLDDAYNANPMSMRAALDELGASAAGRRVAVLGDMLELGPGELDYHRQIGAHATEVADVLVTVGPLSAAMADAFAGEYHHADDAAGASELIRSIVQGGDVVLVKASNGVGLSRVVEELKRA